MNSTTTSSIMNIMRPIIIECEQIYSTINSPNIDIVSGKKRKIVFENNKGMVKRPRYN